MQSVINTVKGTALGVAGYLTPVLKVRFTASCYNTLSIVIFVYSRAVCQLLLRRLIMCMLSQQYVFANMYGYIPLLGLLPDKKYKPASSGLFVILVYSMQIKVHLYNDNVLCDTNGLGTFLLQACELVCIKFSSKHV